MKTVQSVKIITVPQFICGHIVERQKSAFKIIISLVVLFMWCALITIDEYNTLQEICAWICFFWCFIKLFHNVISYISRRVTSLASGQAFDFLSGSRARLMIMRSHQSNKNPSYNPGLVLGLCPANERRPYKVTPSLISWAQTKNHPCNRTTKYIKNYISNFQILVPCKNIFLRRTYWHYPCAIC